MRLKRFISFGSVFLVLCFSMLLGNQDSQNENVVGGTAVKEVRDKLEDPLFDRERAMMEAAGLGDLPTVLLLLENGVQPLIIIDETERILLHEAVTSGRAEVVEAILRAADEAGMLRECIHAMDKQYRTPLYDAALQGNIAVVRLLLDNGALVDTGGQDGLRALHLATIRGNEGLVDFLLSRGAFVLARDADGKTAKEYAIALHHDQLARRLDLETQRYWKKPKVQEIRALVQSYLNALGRGDIMSAFLLSTARHREVIGNELDPVSFQHVIEEIEIHEDEARAIVRITTPKENILFFCLIELYRSEKGWHINRTTYRFTDRWEEIR